jgi:hypothetical protein
MGTITLDYDTICDAKTIKQAAEIVLATPGGDHDLQLWLTKRAIDLRALDALPPQWIQSPSGEKLTLDQSITDADRTKAIVEGNATTDGSIVIRNRADLAAALKQYARGRKDPNLQHVIIRRATEMGLRQLLPPAWAGVDITRSRADAGVNLDEPLGDLFDDPASRTQLDAVLRTMARTLDLSYEEAFTALQSSWQAGQRGELIAGPNLGDVLQAAGVKHLDAFASGCHVLEQRDQAVSVSLDAAMAPFAGDQLDAQGRVMLDSDFDVAHALNDPEESERRWRHARDLDDIYASRERWELDDRMHLDSGIDLLASLRRPLQLAEARQEAGNVARTLDHAIGSATDVAGQQRNLEAALADLQNGSAPDPGPQEQQARDIEVTKTLSQLSSTQLSAAMRSYLHESMSLEAAVEHAKAEHPDRRPPAAAEPQGDREALDQKIHTLMAEESLTYPQALENLTGVELGGTW